MIYKLLILCILILTRFSGASSCQNSSCHQDLKGKKYLHGPMKSNGCVICHPKDKSETQELVGNNKVKHPLLLKSQENNQIKEINNTCFLCHEEFKLQIKHNKTVHKPINEKSCISCHDPHQSDHKNLVKNEGNPQLCLKCHESKSEKNNFMFHRLNEMKNACLSCHSSHFSQNKNLLLKATTKELCLDCHSKDKKVMTWSGLDLKQQHEPVAKGECIKCHKVHGGHNRYLLEKEINLTASFEKELIPSEHLCLKCHQNDKLIETQFKNGNKNLHTLHSVDQKNKKTCFACHDVHGSHQGALIRTEFVYLSKNLPLKFQKTAVGGNCTTACHKKMSYNREMEIVNEKDK